MNSPLSSELKSGAVSWMAHHPVTANLLMMVFLVGGIIIAATQVKMEIYPDFELDFVTVSVPYPGASPEEVEKGIILAVEEAVRGLEGVKSVKSSANEGVGIVSIELFLDTDKNKVTNDIKSAVDRITSFPKDAEEPQISTMTRRREVLDLIIYGDQEEKVLRNIAEMVREDLLKSKHITQVELSRIKPLEISIEVSQAQLRKYNLNIDNIASVIRRSAVELPGGSVKTSKGEILLRTNERRDLGREFEDLEILTAPDGSRVLLSDLAQIKDGFEDIDKATYYNGKSAMVIEVYRIGDETPLEVAAEVKEYKKKLDQNLPPGVKSAIWKDRSELYHQRIDMLKSNAYSGLFLVLLTLGLFLEFRLAFWVTMAIPISFLGTFLFLPVVDISINMISLFGFIVATGMVVDVAIVIGESIYFHREKEKDMVKAAIAGTREVATPVIFSVLTTLVSFAPLAFMPGTFGKVYKMFPMVVVIVLSISLFESIFILPAQLGCLGPLKETGIRGRFYRFQQILSKKLTDFSKNTYGPIVYWTTRNHWLVWVIGLAILLMAYGVIQGGRLKFVFFPNIESDWVTVTAELPFGSPMKETEKVVKLIENGLFAFVDEQTNNHPEKLIGGVSSEIDNGNQIEIVASLVPSDMRKISAEEFTREWRQKVGSLAGLEYINFSSSGGGPHHGKPIDIRLSHSNIQILEKAAIELAKSLYAYPDLKDIDDGFSAGKPQLNFTIKPEARSLGLTAEDIGRQVRNDFWGAEVLRQQRGRDTVRVVVRFPEAERISEHDIEELLIRTPLGGEIPLYQAADIERGSSYTSIQRTDGQRTLDVTAEIISKYADAQEIINSLMKKELPELLNRYSGLSYSFEGSQKEGQESLSSIFSGFIIALIVMYILIAIPFNSYIQPFIVLTAIPFGFFGAIIGHMLLGYELSISSIMGLVAVSGVVVNDSIILVDAANRFRDRGQSLTDAVCQAGIRRFRPIFLTSFTTFVGLVPMMLERSFQARFLIPMAISLGFGVLFATFNTLLMVPALYIIVQDIKALFIETIKDSSKIFYQTRKKIFKS